MHSDEVRRNPLHLAGALFNGKNPKYDRRSMTSEFNPPDNVGRQPRGEEPNEQRQQPETPEEHGGDRFRRYLRQFFQWDWDRRPNTTQSLAFGTWALALVTFIAMLDGRWALEQSQRAWIAPCGFRGKSPANPR